MIITNRRPMAWLLFAVFAVTAAIYWPGLSGGYLFDDFPNIVDNAAIHPQHASIAELARAALSSPSSELKRPLASLSFAANYLISGMDPFWFKLTNLIIHLANGLLFYWLAKVILAFVTPDASRASNRLLALIIAGAWLVLPVNLTAVLYIVQRMESLANLLVVAGLAGYLTGRWRSAHGRRGHALSIISVLLGAAIGTLAKETAVLLPLYALIAEFTIVRYGPHTRKLKLGLPLAALYTLCLLLPAIIGAIWLLPHLFDPQTWLRRDFDMRTRLLSEARIVVSYVAWTLVPTMHALSFYHDNYVPSISLFKPATTLFCTIVVGLLVVAGVALRRRAPLVALVIGLFLAAHSLTATVLPLELIYEHRNYFSSFAVLLLIVPWLAACGQPVKPFMVVARRVLLGGLFLLWTIQTAVTAYAWGEPLRSATEFAWRAPDSPRALYELGRTYVIYSKYDPASPYTARAYVPLENAAKLPGSSILPEQALIFFNSRLHRPIRDEWWQSMRARMLARPAGVQDESALEALSTCTLDHRCDLPKDRMQAAFEAALSQPDPTARLYAIYGNYAWNGLNNHDLGLELLIKAVQKAPAEAAYHITLGRMYAAARQRALANKQLDALRALNHAGSLDNDISGLAATIEHSP